MSEAERRSPARDSRVMRVIAYLGVITAGSVLPVIIPMVPGVIDWLWYVMCAWMVLGGILAGVGQVSGRWVGEYIGLPLLGSALAGFGVLQGGVVEWDISVVPSVALLWSFGLLVFARWRDVTTLYRSAPRGRKS